jgi:hypothetical protein
LIQSQNNFTQILKARTQLRTFSAIFCISHNKMLVTFSVPGYETCVSLHIHPKYPLNCFCWEDIVSANIVANPDISVTIKCLECNGVTLDCKKTFEELGISENACISIQIETCTQMEKMLQMQQGQILSDENQSGTVSLPEPVLEIQERPEPIFPTNDEN